MALASLVGSNTVTSTSLFPGRHRLVEIDAAIYGADEHRLGAETRIVEGKLSLRIGLRVGDRLHAALQLNQDYLHARRGLPGGAILHRAVNGSSSNNEEKTQSNKSCQKYLA